MASLERSPLGQKTPYVDQYEPALLFPLARADKRAEIGISGGLPFFGADYWNAWELSWLNLRGKPQIALANFMVPADTPNLVESKSLKLYLNSFNQTRLADGEELRGLLTQDLSAAAAGPVTVGLILPDDVTRDSVGRLEGYCIDNLDIDVSDYHPTPSSLKCEATEVPVEETLVSHLLKSNCLVTGQPDWGSVQIHYRGRPINREGLLRYIISFRQHPEFHEQCVERMFMDIRRQCQPDALSVYARYTRRGGLDINPFRTSFSQPAPANIRLARQ